VAVWTQWTREICCHRRDWKPYSPVVHRAAYSTKLSCFGYFKTNKEEFI
jgi:hypothetical protein